MNQEIRDKLFERYADELDIQAFTDMSAYTLIHTLIMYKHHGNIESYAYNEHKLSIHMNPADIVPNSIVISDKPQLPDECLDKLTTAFIGRTMQNEQEKYSIYVDADRRVINICKETCGVVETFMFAAYIECIFCALITKLMPWYFSDMPEEIIQEYAPLFVDYEKFPEFEDKFEKFVEDTGIAEQIMMDKLAAIGKNIVDEKRDKMKCELKRIETTIAEQVRLINDKIAQKRYVESQLRAVECEGVNYTTPIDEIVEFLKATSENIVIHDVQGSQVTFKVVTKFEYFDEYEPCVIKGADSSYLFNVGNGIRKYSIAQLKRFYKKLMDKKELSIYGCTYIVLNILSGEVYALKDKDPEPNTMTQPHLGMYSCFGNATGVIMEFVTQDRYVEALNQIIYSSKQLSLQDDIANKHFVDALFKIKCIKCEDGEFRNFDETMEYLGETPEGR